MNPPQKPAQDKFIDSHTWVPPSPTRGILGRSGASAGEEHQHRTQWAPTFRRATSMGAPVSLRSDGYTPEWSRGLSSQRPRTAGWSGGGSDRSQRQRRADRTECHHHRSRQQQPSRYAAREYDDDFGESAVSRDVRDVLFGGVGSPYKWHPHDVREDLFDNKGSDAQRAAGYGQYGMRGPAPDACDVDDGAVRDLTAQAMDKVVNKVVRKIMAK
jgi:hypothetical protein